MPEGNQLGGDGPDAARYPLGAQGRQALVRETPYALFKRHVRLFVDGAQAMLTSQA